MPRTITVTAADFRQLLIRRTGDDAFTITADIDVTFDDGSHQTAQRRRTIDAGTLYNRLTNIWDDAEADILTAQGLP